MSKELMPDETPEYYLLSHGLYFRPEARGYTGIRDEAGLFTKAYADSYCEGSCAVTMLHKDNPKATETMPETYRDLIDKHIRKLKQERDDALRELELTPANPAPREVTVEEAERMVKEYIAAAEGVRTFESVNPDVIDISYILIALKANNLRITKEK